MMMTNRERLLSVYSNRLPDRIPIGMYRRYHRVGETERRARNDGLGIIDFVPPVSLLAPLWHVHPGYVSEVSNVQFRIDHRWVDNRLMQRRAYETPVGTIDAHVVLDAQHGTEWTTKHYIETAEDYKIVQYVAEHTVFRSQEPAIRQALLDLGEDGILFGRADRSPYQKLLVELVDPQRLILDLHHNPGPIEELMQVIDARLDEQFDGIMESGIRVVWQPDNVTADWTPPSHFRKYCLPFYRKRGEQARKAAKIYAVHIDGKTSGIKDLIAEAPIDVVESFSLPEMAGDLSVSAAREAWPGKVVCPNFPANLCLGTREEIDALLGRLLAEFGRETPFAIQISEDIPLESYGFVLPLLSAFTATHAAG